MNVGPGTIFTATSEVGAFASGLTGAIGMAILDDSGAVVVARTTLGIAEVASIPTLYIGTQFFSPSPSSLTHYLLDWDDGEVHYYDDLYVSATINPPTPTGMPVPGPCVSWATAGEVAACCNASVGSNPSVFDDVVAEASQLLFELSGRQFNGTCGQTVRPFTDGCGCWGSLFSPAQIPAISYGYTWGWWGGGLGWGWGYDGCGSVLGCGSLSRTALPGFPVTEITQVLIDGVPLSEYDNDGVLNWRLDGWRWLTRMADVSGGYRFWPSCQRLDRQEDETGTWAVTYLFGQNPPLLGIKAAAQLACELYKLCSGDACALPQGATKIDRQGITIERPPFLSWARQKGIWATGLQYVDAFLSAYNPAGLKRPSTVWSPDIAPFAERVGLGSGS